MTFASGSSGIEWGKVTKKSILKKLHKGKSLKSMSDGEFRRAIKDLI